MTWTVIECMGNGEPTVVFDGTTTRKYVSIRRRDTYRNSKVTAEIGNITTETLQAHARVQRTLHIDKYPELRMIALPIFGPRNVPFGVQLWLAPSDEEPTPPRLIGAFDWDPATQITFHGPTIESDILAIDDVKEQRVSPEVFKHFEYFPRDAELGPFIAEVESGRTDDGETFDSALTIRRADGEVRQAYMTMRAVNQGESWTLRGLVHDVTDVELPDTARAFDRRIARMAATMVEGSWGIGHMDFSTGIVTEWLTTPPAPLDEWTVSNAEYHPHDVPHMAQAQQQLAVGSVEKVDYHARVRFAGGPWIVAAFTLSAAITGPRGHGLIRVEAVLPDDHEPADASDDNSSSGGILLW